MKLCGGQETTTRRRASEEIGTKFGTTRGWGLRRESSPITHRDYIDGLRLTDHAGKFKAEKN
jgi:hypothetical protein